MERTRQFVLHVSDEDYEICKRYGFDFNKNFEEMVKEVAEELRVAEFRKLNYMEANK